MTRPTSSAAIVTGAAVIAAQQGRRTRSTTPPPPADRSALPRIAEADPAEGYLTESWMAAIVTGSTEAKQQRAVKVKRS
ncbi:hypothetical protein [Nonomuraea lactucae]|uniref:hypothetical protein n=1 Tax=Nonomuraea lactucae TaxID=2249762 RepID=UPI0019635768|nr:hypothetical protein [Nonomuraea lactucae]